MMDAPAATTHLEAAFRTSTHYLLQERCIQALAAIGDTTVAPDLRALLETSTIANSRSMSARYLGQLRDSTSVPILMAAFRGDPAKPVQLAAAESLVTLGKGLDIAPELESFLDSSNETFKIEAARILARIPDPRRLHALRETLLWDPVPGVKIASAHALGGIPTAEAARTLKNVYDQISDSDLRLEIIRSLGHIPRPEAQDALLEILKSAEYATVKVALLEALSSAGDKQQLRVLVTYLSDHQPDVRLQAAAGVYRLTRNIHFNLSPTS
jgi:HEAT repeat protein